MPLFDNMVRRIGWVAIVVGSSLLLLTMILVMTNVVSRRFGYPILGVYESVELMMVVVVAGALGYTQLEKRHIAISLLAERLRQRPRAFLSSLVFLLNTVAWAIVFWACGIVMVEKWFIEYTEVLEVTTAPFRLVLGGGFLFLCVVLLRDFFRALGEGVRK